MGSTKRIAIGIDVSVALRHHLDCYNGILTYAEGASWSHSIDPFVDPRRSVGGPIDGIVARASRRTVRSAQRAGVPLVNLLHNSPAFTAAPSVIPDYVAAGRMAAEHLIATGFRRFGLIGYQPDRSQREMNSGFLAVLREAGLKCNHTLMVPWASETQPDTWYRLLTDVTEWVSTWETPLAVFANRDLMAHYLIDIARDQGLQTPGDWALVCTESCPYMCTHRSPTITSIDLAFREVGRQAAATLDRLMKGLKTQNEPIRVSPAGLIRRDTTDFFAGGDALLADAMRFLRDNFTDSINVNDVANHVHTTRRTIERRFRENLGSTVRLELSKLRLDEAKRLLIDSDLLIKQIAHAVGIGDTKRFNDVFRKLEGCLPTEFRRRYGRQTESGDS